MGPEKTIVVNELTKTFGRFKAVDAISFEVEKGEIFGFLGPNGAGKSTTIRMLNGLLLPTSGQGSVGGFDIIRQSEQIKHHIGYMSQRFSLYGDLTAEENLTFFGGIYGLSTTKVKERAHEVLNLVGLLERRSELTRNLALGLRQRLALASAILHQPPILFLDEPTSGVDPISRRNFWDLIYDMADRGITILVTTHYMEEAEFCDRLVLIYQGRLIAQGTPSDLKRTLPGQIIAIYPERLAEALELVRQLPQIAEAALFADGIHAAAAQAEEAESAVKQTLAAHGIVIRRIQRLEPSLEDAFISLIETAGGN